MKSRLNVTAPHWTAGGDMYALGRLPELGLSGERWETDDTAREDRSLDAIMRVSIEPSDCVLALEERIQKWLTAARAAGRRSGERSSNADTKFLAFSVTSPHAYDVSVVEKIFAQHNTTHITHNRTNSQTHTHREREMHTHTHAHHTHAHTFPSKLNSAFTIFRDKRFGETSLNGAAPHNIKNNITPTLHTSAACEIATP